MTTPLLGRSAPKALNSVRRSAAVPMPSRKPTTPPTKPSASPSLTTARQIWRRDAPRVRSSANSRMRWATVIEKVLKIRKAPTNSAMKANASRKVFRNPRLSRMSLDSLSACSWPVRTSTVGPSVRASWVLSCWGDTPGLAATWISSKPSPLPSIRWASGSTRSSTAAPPNELRPAICVVPTSV